MVVQGSAHRASCGWPDTTFQRWGRKVEGSGRSKDPVRSTAQDLVFVNRLNLVSVALLPPPGGGMPLALPVCVRRYRQQGPTPIEPAAAMLRELGEWLPERELEVVADGPPAHSPEPACRGWWWSRGSAATPSATAPTFPHGGPVSEVAPAPRPSAAFGRPAGPGPRPGLASLPGRGPGTAGGAIGLHPGGALVVHRSGGAGAAGGARSPRSQPGYLPLHHRSHGDRGAGDPGRTPIGGRSRRPTGAASSSWERRILNAGGRRDRSGRARCRSPPPRWSGTGRWHLG